LISNCTGLHYATRVNDDMHLNNNVVIFSHDEKGLKMLKTFLSRPRSRPRLISQDQDQDQDLCFCPRGASRPRPWSRGLHHCM